MNLIDLFNSLSPELRDWASVWISDGAYEDPPFEGEPPLVTAKLRSFRLAYKNASDDQIEEFLNQI